MPSKELIHTHDKYFNCPQVDQDICQDLDYHRFTMASTQTNNKITKLSVMDVVCQLLDQLMLPIAL